MRNATLIFLVKKADNKIYEICLAMKKRGFGQGRWNGAGGKVEEGESIEESAKRETKEEIGVDINDLEKVGELDFYFSHNPVWDQKVHVYISQNWQGEPSESEEMKPAWFSVANIPFNEMWPDDTYWLPEVLEGNKVKAKFTFGPNDTILEHKVELVSSLS